MLILIQSIERFHLIRCQLEIEDLSVGDDPLLRIGFRERYESEARRRTRNDSAKVSLKTVTMIRTERVC